MPWHALYILDDAGNPAPCDHIYTWRAWFDAADRTLTADLLPSGTRVQTLFLSLNHAFQPGPAVLWETTVAGGPFDGTLWRYASASAARDGHQVIVATVMETEATMAAYARSIGKREVIAA